MSAPHSLNILNSCEFHGMGMLCTNGGVLVEHQKTCPFDSLCNDILRKLLILWCMDDSPVAAIFMYDLLLVAHQT